MSSKTGKVKVKVRASRTSHVDSPDRPAVPPTPAVRNCLRDLAHAAVAARKIVPPISLDELTSLTNEVLAASGVDESYRDYLAVLVSNEIWRDSVARIPFNRRLLLLPRCLRDVKKCRGKIDAVGLVCAECGACPLASLQQKATRLGYAVMIAEGSAVVMSLIASGKIQAVIGASCMAALARVYPYMEAGAVPGLAIPLNRDGCVNTTIDLDWLNEAIDLQADNASGGVDIESLRRHVNGYFSPSRLTSLLGRAQTPADAMARKWLLVGGKRWRPLLSACICAAMGDDPSAAPPDDFAPIAVAVECFHKASLIHDDIEDDDAIRYGKKTLHAEHGVPVALNVGDLLLGEGYRLLAGAAGDDAMRTQMIAAAADAHRTLCQGQGMELAWARKPKLISSQDVLEIFIRKTAPAFEVALRLGAIYRRADAATMDVLSRFSLALGVAYQIRDDLEDVLSPADGAGDLRGVRPSLLLALAAEKSSPSQRAAIRKFWFTPSARKKSQLKAIRKMLVQLEALQSARFMLMDYRRRATDALGELENSSVKGLLRRVLGKIFSDTDELVCQCENT